MGLIKAGIGAAGGMMADQWKEFIYCDSLDSDVLVAKGQKRTSRRSSNTTARPMTIPRQIWACGFLASSAVVNLTS